MSVSILFSVIEFYRIMFSAYVRGVCKQKYWLKSCEIIFSEYFLIAKSGQFLELDFAPAYNVPLVAYASL